ncbi:hypothetical protein ACO0K7_16465 [Undibacterium sp. Ji67W]|uniref:hypothetical protein n=1 Tax=Undibacterium sp. Ji67W TaxID=3413042 RepID=UPI003BF31EC2
MINEKKLGALIRLKKQNMELVDKFDELKEKYILDYRTQRQEIEKISALLKETKEKMHEAEKHNKKLTAHNEKLQAAIKKSRQLKISNNMASKTYKSMSGRGTIDFVIQEALKRSEITDSKDWKLVRYELDKMANANDRPSPLTGARQKKLGFPYKDCGEDTFLGWRSLKSRIATKLKPKK